jgi:[ribosomal protein S18]-alanine N-acetyltransferase
MSYYDDVPYVIEPMRVADIPEVMEVERLSFSMPWSARAFKYQVEQNEMSRYFVARRREKPRSLWSRLTAGDLGRTAAPILGYVGFWLMVDEAHISNIATHPDWRRRGIGELMLAYSVDRATELGAVVVTLEARVTNAGAQALYRKYGLEVVGRRPHYYSDNGEDALIMSTPRLTSAEYRRLFNERKGILAARLVTERGGDGVGAAQANR